jgi:hypothetical protein
MPLKSLFKSAARRRQSSADAAIADPIIDRLVQATDRRLATLRGYREALRGPVIAARGRLAEMIARVPGPTEVSPGAWSREPGLRPLFVKADDAASAWGNDRGVREFFEKHPASDCFGMLALRQADRRVLAMVQQEAMQVEVARTTVSFAEPQVLAPSADEAAARGELALRALEYLALRAMERVGALRAEKRELERERALLQAQLQLARRQGRGFDTLSAQAQQPGADPENLERELGRTVAALEQAASRELLPALLGELQAALAHPEAHLTIEPCAIALDPMNFAVAPSPEAITPCVAVLELAERGPFAVLLARFPRAELRAPENRLAEAARYL